MLKKLKENFKANSALSIILIISIILFLVSLLRINIICAILSLFLSDSCFSGITQNKLKLRISELEDKVNNQTK
jgi:hypothetical protein